MYWSGSFTVLSYIQMGKQNGCSFAKKNFAPRADSHRGRFSRGEFIFVFVLFGYLAQDAAGVADSYDA